MAKQGKWRAAGVAIRGGLPYHEKVQSCAVHVQIGFGAGSWRVASHIRKVQSCAVHCMSRLASMQAVGESHAAAFAAPAPTPIRIVSVVPLPAQPCVRADWA